MGVGLRVARTLLVARIAAVLATVAPLLGCVASSRYMLPATTPLSVAPPPGAATVVFVRPSAFAAAQKFTILDTRGSFLGESLPASQFAVGLPPGEHVFLAIAENTPALQAYLAPDRVYYVEVSSRLGLIMARGQLLALKPNSRKWQELDGWVREVESFTVDHPSGQANLNSRGAEIRSRIRSAQQTWAGYSRDQRAERTLRAEDGVPIR